MRVMLAVATCAALVVTAGAVHRARAGNAPARCSAAASTQLSDQNPSAVMAYWTKERIEQAHRNMRNGSVHAASANGSCSDVP